MSPPKEEWPAGWVPCRPLPTGYVCAPGETEDRGRSCLASAISCWTRVIHARASQRASSNTKSSALRLIKRWEMKSTSSSDRSTPIWRIDNPLPPSSFPPFSFPSRNSEEYTANHFLFKRLAYRVKLKQASCQCSGGRSRYALQHRSGLRRATESRSAPQAYGWT